VPEEDSGDSPGETIPVMIYDSSSELSESDKEKITQWLTQRLQVKEVKIVEIYTAS